MPTRAATSRRRSISADPSRRAACGFAALLALLLPLFAACATPAGQGLLPGRVLKVVDGDTLDVRLQSGRVRVRLQGVDAPERDQPGGAEATRFLAGRLHDADVLLEPVSQDQYQYQRLVAVVHLGRVNINEELVEQGHAWAFRRYLRREDRALCALEQRAREAGRGLWQARLQPARAPWEHRATRGRGPFTDFSAETEECVRSSQRRKRG